MAMQIPNSTHAARPWRIHDLTGGFRLEDAWSLRTPGAREDFPRLVHAIAAGDPSKGSSRAAGALWAIRWKLGELLGWDDEDADTPKPTLRDRLSPDLAGGPAGPEFTALPFSSLYLLEDEWAAEIANRTVHAVMHVGWVEDHDGGGYHGEIAVYVKPNGLLGNAYMLAIRPFRHLIVYPATMAKLERTWRAGAG